MTEQQKPPLFPTVPKSALFSKLEAFLPVMAEANKKMTETVAAGQGYRHNIEVEKEDEEEEDQSSGYEDDWMAGASKKKAAIIEMNFALGTMDENGSDGEDTDDKILEAPMKATNVNSVHMGSTQHDEDKSSFQMRLERVNSKPRPLIQELD